MKCAKCNKDLKRFGMIHKPVETVDPNGESHLFYFCKECDSKSLEKSYSAPLGLIPMVAIKNSQPRLWTYETRI